MGAGINAFTVSVAYSALTLNPSPITCSSQGEGLVFVPLRPLWAKGLGDEGVFAPKPECTRDSTRYTQQRNDDFCQALAFTVILAALQSVEQCYNPCHGLLSSSCLGRQRLYLKMPYRLSIAFGSGIDYRYAKEKP
jgi:hypothetical protein